MLQLTKSVLYSEITLIELAMAATVFGVVFDMFIPGWTSGVF